MNEDGDDEQSSSSSMLLMPAPPSNAPLLSEGRLQGPEVKGVGEKSDNDNMSEDANNIAKAIRFWKHPSLREIPLEQKRQYLYEKGVTEDQIHKAWDRILEEEEEKPEARPASAAPTPTPPPLPTTAHPPPLYPPQVPPPATNMNPHWNQHQPPSMQPTNSSYPLQDPYQQQYAPPPQSPYGPPPYEEEGPGPFLQGVSLVALGGFVGLTAAAAARWLNGGDFQLLPPPALPGELKDQRLILRGSRPGEEDGNGNNDYQEMQDGNQIETVEEEYATTDDDEEADEDYMEEEDELHLLSSPEAQEKLLQEVQTISETMKAHVSVQEKILQKLTSQGASITNHSMELLRASSGISKNDKEDESSSTLLSSKRATPEVLLLWAQLLELKNDLRNLQGPARRQEDSVAKNGRDDAKAWEIQLEALLPKLDYCIQSIQDSFASHPTKNANSLAVPSTSSTTAPIPSSGTTEVSSSATAPPVKLSGTSTKDEASSPLSPQAPSVKDEDTTCTDLADVPKTISLRQAIRKMAQENDATTLRVGSQLLYLYIINLTGNTSNPRYRKIFTTNESFQKVEATAGGKALLLAVGFEERKGCLEWLASVNPPTLPEAEGLAMAKLQEAATALGILKSGKPSADLTQRALAVVTPDPDVQLVLASPVPQPSTLPADETSLIGPPPPKKVPNDHASSDGETTRVEEEEAKPTNESISPS